MRHLRTKLATDGAEPGILERLLRRFIPDANPDYEFHRVREWLIEFDDEGFPGREVGLDDRGEPVLAGPDDRNYGFWLDTNLRFEDFEGVEIEAREFEATWLEWREGPRGT